MPPLKRGEIPVGDAELEAFEDDFLFIRHIIAIGVGEEQHLRRGSHEDAVAPRRDTRRVAQVFREDLRVIGATIAVGVAQQPDRATGFALDAVRIIAHLHDIGVAIGSEAESDRIDDVGLLGEQG